MDATRPVARGKNHDPALLGADNAQPANRKHERMARRELLYSVVRAAMTRAGILSASYKFKVLSLDGRGRQFLVMVDISRDQDGDVGKLAEVEALIAQAAKARHDIVVSAVYWRTNEHVAIGDPLRARAEPNQMPLESQPAALDSSPAPLVPHTAAQPSVLAPSAKAPLQKGGARFEPIHADEVAAFKQALAEGATRGRPAVAAPAVTADPAATHGATARAFDGSAVHGPQSYTLLTGFEDTELPDADMKNHVLSGTQYGELR